MVVKPSSTPSTFVDVTSHSVEQVTEELRKKGWEGEYRQLSKGRVTSRFRSLSLGPCALSAHHLDQRLHVHRTSPNGCVSLLIMPPPNYVLVDGVEMGKDHVLVLDAGTEIDFVSPGDATAVAFTLPKSYFEATARVLFPRTAKNGGPIRIIPCPASGWAGLHREVSGLLRNGSMSPEDISLLLNRFLGLLAGEREEREKKVHLNNWAYIHVARRAQEFIDDNFRQPIRMEELCRYTGVSVSTLWRSFSRYFQVAPGEYIKARRFNAVRHALMAGDPSRQQVGQIALANGFTHLGRFSVEYSKFFGESATETLARPMSNADV